MGAYVAGLFNQVALDYAETCDIVSTSYALFFCLVFLLYISSCITALGVDAFDWRDLERLTVSPHAVL